MRPRATTINTPGPLIIPSTFLSESKAFDLILLRQFFGHDILYLFAYHSLSHLLLQLLFLSFLPDHFRHVRAHHFLQVQGGAVHIHVKAVHAVAQFLKVKYNFLF